MFGRSTFLAAGIISIISWVGAAEDRDGPRVSMTPRVIKRPQAAVNASIRVDSKLVLIPVTVTDALAHRFEG